MKESLIKSLRQQGKSWKEVSKEVGGHPNYLSSRFGKKAKKVQIQKQKGMSLRQFNYEEYDRLNPEKTAKELISAMRLIQELGGTVVF